MFESYDGTRLAYRSIGSGPLLICLPGGPGRNSVYLENLAGLDETNTLVLLDARGTGESALPADEFSYSAESLARDVDALRKHLGLARLRLLGHSAGAIVALVYAATFPEQLERLVLVTTSITPGDTEARNVVVELREGEPWYPEARAAWDGLPYAGAREKQRLEREVRPFYYGAWSEREQEHAESAEHQMSPRAASRFAVTTPPEQLREAWSRLASPTLVIAGEFDAMTPPVSGEIVAAAIPGARLAVIDGAGHFPWVDAPEPFRAAIETFLAAR